MNNLFKYNKQKISRIFKLPLQIYYTNTNNNIISNRNNRYNKNNSNNINKIQLSKIIQDLNNNNNQFNNKFNNKNNKIINKNNIIKPSNKKINIPKIFKKSIVSTKETIPKRIRELVWTTFNGEVFENKCYVGWCKNPINVFNFQVGHDIPESKGGTLDITNLKPICSSCNLSMSNKYSITEWSKLIKNTNTIYTNDNNNIIIRPETIINPDTIITPETVITPDIKDYPEPIEIQRQTTFIHNIYNKLATISLFSMVLGTFKYIKI